VSSTAKSSGPAPSPATVEIESNTSLIAKIAENEEPALQYQDKKCLLRIIVAKFGVYISSYKKNQRMWEAGHVSQRCTPVGKATHVIA
jgi:hypothetical protein